MIEENKVFVVHAADEGCTDNRGIAGEGYTISKDQAVTGWETDGGHSSYGLTKEDAEYYAKCINEYPRLLSIIKQTENVLDWYADETTYENYGEGIVIWEDKGKLAKQALQAIRK